MYQVTYLSDQHRLQPYRAPAQILEQGFRKNILFCVRFKVCLLQALQRLWGIHMHPFILRFNT